MSDSMHESEQYPVKHVAILIKTVIFVILYYIIDLTDIKLAPITKPSAGSTGKSGAGQLGKSTGGKSTFGSNISKTGSFGSTASKTSSLGNTSKSSAKPSFFPASNTGLTPSTSKKNFETVSYSPRNGKASTSLGIIWLPTKKRNKKKEVAYSSMNYDKKNERAPSMYSYNKFMSGDSPDFQLHKKKDDESNLLIPERLKGPIATVASAGAVATIAEEPPSDNSGDVEDKLLKRDEESKEAAGDAKDSDYLENKEPIKPTDTKLNKSSDKVDSAFLSSTGPIKSPPPRSTESSQDDEDCGIKCLYYTLQCCDCVLM